MSTTKTPEVQCHACLRPLDRASHAEATPEADDVSLCLYCGALSQFNADLTLRPCVLASLHPSEQAEVRKTWERLGFKWRNRFT